MGKNSTIEWTHHTFNPWWGCTKVSQACKLCYAEAWARRTGGRYWGPRAPRRFFGEQHWREPIAWDEEAFDIGRRSRVFCASMADVFEFRTELNVWREKLWDLIESTPNLDWLLLTKRPQRIALYNRWGIWPTNVWLGTTVENQKTADERIPQILENSASVRFLSCEPLIGPIDISRYLSAGIGWVIAGGESGGKSRPSHPRWMRDLRDQCINANVPFLFKQWGNWAPVNVKVATQSNQVHIFPDGEAVQRHNKKESGRLLDGRTWDDVPVIEYGRPVTAVRIATAQQDVHSRI
jgi:protein gp37